MGHGGPHDCRSCTKPFDSACSLWTMSVMELVMGVVKHIHFINNNMHGTLNLGVGKGSIPLLFILWAMSVLD